MDDDPTSAGREMRVRAAVSAAGYGLGPRLALFAVLPYLDKELDVMLPSGERVTRGTSGIGDLRLGRYTAYRRDGPGRAFRIAPVFGVELPTGRDDARDAFGELPPTLQVGSGSVDTFAGIVLTRQTLHYQMDAQLSYQRNSEANDFEFGDVLRARCLPPIPAFVPGASFRSSVLLSIVAIVRRQPLGGFGLLRAARAKGAWCAAYIAIVRRYGKVEDAVGT